jgi:hypothetical protein
VGQRGRSKSRSLAGWKRKFYSSLHVTSRIFSNLNKSRSILKTFSGRADGRTDMTQSTVAFQCFPYAAKTPLNVEFCQILFTVCDTGSLYSSAPRATYLHLRLSGRHSPDAPHSRHATHQTRHTADAPLIRRATQQTRHSSDAPHSRRATQQCPLFVKFATQSGPVADCSCHSATRCTHSAVYRQSDRVVSAAPLRSSTDSLMTRCLTTLL